ncbi:MAG: spore germination protein [Negativicutes bacterium]|nr:spore germination protein [Negativicutes bacterium]
MEKNILAILIRAAKTFLVYQPPSTPHRFVLAENDDDNNENPAESDPLGQIIAQHETLLRQARRLSRFMERLSASLVSGESLSRLDELKKSYDALAVEQAKLTPLLMGYSGSDQNMSDQPISAILEENRRTIEALYELPASQGVAIRIFDIAVLPPAKAMLLYLEGLSDKKMVGRMVLEPLMSLKGQQQESEPDAVVSRLLCRHLPAGGTSLASNFAAVQDGVNSGYTALFIEGCTEAILIDTKEIEHRAVERPLIEQTVRGSQQGFTELLNTNVALIRNSLMVSDLVSETFVLGTRSRTKCAVLYIKSLANPRLVAEVKRRIEGLKVDYIGDTSTLDLYIEDSPSNPYPQALITERPDRVVSHLAEGRAAVVLDGCPTALVVPVTLLTLLHSPDDYSMQYFYSSLMRTLRIIGAALSMLLPAFYLSISIHHPEAIPTDLMLTIATARQQVPFPSLVEILIMELAFELIREGGIRVPGILGPTIGIVGAIIIGQAAVVAKIVSPIMILIIAVTGLASYVVPDYRLANAIRLTRFGFLLLAASFGLVGVAAGMVSLGAALGGLKSFGVPYLAPVTPRTFYGRDVVLRGPVYDQELRPDFLQPLDKYRQPHISRTWKQAPPEGSEDR